MEERELLEVAWNLIANANDGNWKNASADWVVAAVKFREAYFKYLKQPISQEEARRRAHNVMVREGSAD